MIIPAEKLADRIRLIAIETMKGAFGNEGALRFFELKHCKLARALVNGRQVMAFPQRNGEAGCLFAPAQC